MDEFPESQNSALVPDRVFKNEKQLDKEEPNLKMVRSCSNSENG